MRRISIYIVLFAFLLAAIGIVLWNLSKSPTYQLFGELVPRVGTSEKIVALTFDDGPTPVFTDQIRCGKILINRDRREADRCRAYLA